MGIPLHVHSSFSPLDGLCHPEEIVEFAKKNGLRFIAITETNGFFGLQFFLQAAREKGIIPLVGAQLKFLDFRLVVLCSSKAGYEKLCTLISLINFEKIDKELFFQHLEAMAPDVVLFSDNKQLLSKISNYFAKDRLYFEISPGFFDHSDVSWARNMGLELLATTRARYIDPKDHLRYLLVCAIRLNKTLSSIQLHDYNESCRLYSPKDFYNLFTPYPQAVKNTYKVAEICQFEMGEQAIVFPKFNNLKL